MRRLFVFRPEAAARQTILKAQDLGLEAVSIPLFELQSLEWLPPDPSGPRISNRSPAVAGSPGIRPVYSIC